MSENSLATVTTVGGAQYLETEWANKLNQFFNKFDSGSPLSALPNQTLPSSQHTALHSTATPLPSLFITAHQVRKQLEKIKASKAKL